MGAKKKIAVICASPPGINPGMSSVDLAFMSLATKYGFSDQVTLYQLYSTPKYNLFRTIRNKQLRYSIIPDDKDFFKSQNLIIFWGDFLHMFQYHETVVRRLLTRNKRKDAKWALNRVREIFLLKGNNAEVFKKSFSFGSTILFNTIQDEINVDYKLDIEHFLMSVEGIWFRDVFSALKACHIQGAYHPSCLGVDCATLNNPDNFIDLDSRANPTNKVGIFIGRNLNHIAKIIEFANELTLKIEGDLTWLNWGDFKAFPHLREVKEVINSNPIDGYNVDGIIDAEQALRNIVKYDLIITDTYHVCVNSWNLGVPAICFYGDDIHKKPDVNSGNVFSKRDKRQVFMSMYDGLDFLISYSELTNINFRKDRLNVIMDRLNTGSEIKAIHNRLRQHALQSEKIFIDSISKYL